MKSHLGICFFVFKMHIILSFLVLHCKAGKVSPAETVFANSDKSYCGYLETKEPFKIKTDIFEGQPISREVFQRLNNLRGGSVIITNDQCRIEICGFAAGAHDYHNIGVCTVFKNHTSLLQGHFAMDYKISSLSCGCYKNVTSCGSEICSDMHVTEDSINSETQDYCAILYQEDDCQSCFFDKIILKTQETYETKNAVAVKSIRVHTSCFVRMETFGRQSIEQHYNNYFYRTTNALLPTFFHQGETFHCSCPKLKVASVPQVVEEPNNTEAKNQLTSYQSGFQKSTIKLYFITLIAAGLAIVLLIAITFIALIKRSRFEKIIIITAK